MKEHLKRIKNKDIFQHYVGKDIQNELINLIAKEIVNGPGHVSGIKLGSFCLWAVALFALPLGNLSLAVYTLHSTSAL